MPHQSAAQSIFETAFKHPFLKAVAKTVDAMVFTRKKAMGFESLEKRLRK